MNCKKFLNNSIEALVKYIKNNHLKSLVLGISGGIDSTVVAAIASEACKQCNIPLIGRSLPSGTNKIEEKDAAELVGEAFCNDYKEVDISKLYNIFNDESTLQEGESTNLQKGNIKARIRMMYLYHLASIHKGLVLDTGNKTEYELGFFTIHGDQGDYNPGIIYLWKTDVYYLAEYIASYYLEQYQETKDTNIFNKRLAILKSLSLIPTDGNGVSNSDCEQFGLHNYEQVDDVLQTMYFSKNDALDLVKGNSEKLINYKNHGIILGGGYVRLIDSYNEQGVDRVMLLHQNTKFKREHLPIHPSYNELQ